MTHFSFSTSRFRVYKASSKSYFNSLFLHNRLFGGSASRPNFTVSDREVIVLPSYIDAWAVKVISTLCILHCSKSSLDFTFLEYFSERLNPLITFEVVKRLNHPTLALKFFEFSRVNSDFEEHNQNTHYLSKSYNLLVKSLCEMGHHEAASELVFDGYSPDSSILGFLISSCGQAGKFDIAKGLIVQALKNNIEVNYRLYNNLLDLLVKRNLVDEAVSFFKEQHLRFNFHPDTCSFNIFIKGLCRLGEVDRAFEFLNDMGSFGCSPDLVTYNILIDGLCRVNQVDRGRELLKEARSKSQLSPDVVTFTSIISGYRRLGKMEEASSLFNEMVNLGIRPNSFTYNVLIDGFGKSCEMGSAVSMYEKMLLQGCSPDVVTLTSLIDGYCRIGKVDEAMKLWQDMGTRKISPNAYTFAILINGLCKENRLNEARELLRQLKWRNIGAKSFHFNPVIDGFCKSGNVDEANVIMEEMKEMRCHPDKMTYTILIIGHCMKGRMSEAISIFHMMLTTGCAPDSITVNTLTSCLLKAGMPHEANQILLIVSQKGFGLCVSSPRKIHSVRRSIDIPVAGY